MDEMDGYKEALSAGCKDEETDTYLLVELHKGWLELLLDVVSKVVWILVVRV